MANFLDTYCNTSSLASQVTWHTGYGHLCPRFPSHREIAAGHRGNLRAGWERQSPGAAHRLRCSLVGESRQPLVTAAKPPQPYLAAQASRVAPTIQGSLARGRLLEPVPATVRFASPPPRGCPTIPTRDFGSYLAPSLPHHNP